MVLLDVDHCFPWVAWPCGDLWNLLPSSRQVNQRLKRDRLVDVATLASARDRIADWWSRGYARAPTHPVSERFVREAVATLSIDHTGDETRLLDEIYAGVEWLADAPPQRSAARGVVGDSRGQLLSCAL